jgi:hypothetical protein
MLKSSWKKAGSLCTVHPGLISVSHFLYSANCPEVCGDGSAVWTRATHWGQQWGLDTVLTATQAVRGGPESEAGSRPALCPRLC